MASPITVLGFEQGTAAGLGTGAVTAAYMDRLVGTTGTNIEVVSAAARTGSYGLRLSPAAAIAHAGWANAGNNGILGSSGTLVGSFWFRFPTLPTVDFNIFIGIGTAGGQDFFLKYLNSTTGLQAVVGASTQVGPTITANTWVHVDFRLVLNANPHTLDWTVNGSAQTAISLAVATENLFIAGFSSDNGTQNGVLHVDDAVMSLTSGDYPLGKHKVQQLIPDTAGTAVEIGTANATGRMVTNSAIDATFNSANILTAISEVPPLLSGASTGLGQRTLSTTSACGIPMTTYTLSGGETITGVRAVICAWAANATAAANTLGVRTFNGTSETIVFAAAAYQGQNTTTPAWICKMATGTDFDTQAELDALVMRVGYSGDVTPLPGAHAVYAEVAVKESTGASQTADASLSGTGTLTSTATAAKSADASLAATATASTTATASKTVDASLSGTASATGSATSSITVNAALSGTGTLSSTATPSRIADGSLAGTGSLTGTATSVKFPTATAVATGTLAATATTAKSVDSTLPGTGTLSSTATVGRIATASLSATGTLAATATVTSSAGVDGALAGTGTLTSTATSVKPVAAALASTGVLTATATTDKSLSGSLAGTGVLTGAATATKPVAASLAATGTLAATASVSAAPSVSMNAALSGTGTLASTTLASRPAVAALSATATATAQMVVTRSMSAVLVGTGSLTASATAASQITVRPNTGSTTRPASGRTIRPYIGTTTRA